MKWRILWLSVGVLFFAGWWAFRHDVRELLIPAEGAFRPFYRSTARGNVGYALGTIGVVYAIYIIVSLVRRRMSDLESKVHLAIWTVVPPLWFFFEYFIWFDNHNAADAVQRLKEAQDVASKLWGAVLAVMISYRLGDIVKTALSPREVSEPWAAKEREPEDDRPSNIK